MATPPESLKVSLTLGSATLNIEGSKETVQKEIERFYELFGASSSQPGGGRTPTGRGSTRKATAQSSGGSRKTSGTSCAGRIEGLLADGFFEEPRTIKETADELETKATPYPSNHIGAALQQLTRKGTLRR